MSVIITFMFEPAKLQMNCASARGTRMRRSEPDGRPTLTPSATSRRLSAATEVRRNEHIAATPSFRDGRQSPSSEVSALLGYTQTGLVP